MTHWPNFPGVTRLGGITQFLPPSLISLQLFQTGCESPETPVSPKVHIGNVYHNTFGFGAFSTLFSSLVLQIKQKRLCGNSNVTVLTWDHSVNQQGQNILKIQSKQPGVKIKKLTKNLILQNTFVKCEVLAHCHSIILACFHQPQQILQRSLQGAQQGVCVGKQGSRSPRIWTSQSELKATR